ncbi:hypothetical protein SAMN05421542_0690 [Chryseobacterium jejuense]|uniref:Uncharacterized protein n=1 Tax=Chryseobacterium jejuense TaxID=445960 RepID=A0A2X2X957_CHRJE|nr:hypothetical protein SAMN05421542_0690 [Chryseobacterium jejuense]SQB44565.1 Uncharacterised protein [Chryseobacterium jejuense]
MKKITVHFPREKPADQNYRLFYGYKYLSYGFGDSV